MPDVEKIEAKDGRLPWRRPTLRRMDARAAEANTPVTGTDGTHITS